MKDYFGLDIGAEKVKIVQLKKKSDNKLQLIAMGEAVLSSSATSNESVVIAEAIKKLVKDLSLKTNLAVVSIPEKEIISRARVFPPMKEEEIKYALEFEAETFIPYPLDQAEVDYEILEKSPEGKITVFAVAVKKTLIEERIKLLKAAKLAPLAVETSTIALTRALRGLIEKKTACVIDMAADSVNLAITDDAKVFLTRSLSFGGKAFTRAVSIGLGLDLTTAEEYKRVYGLKRDQLEGKVANAILPIFNSFIEEVRKALVLFHEERGKSAEAIILTGGGAILPNLSEEMVKVMGIEVQIAKPLMGINIEGAQTNVAPAEDDFRFAIATGLAQREF